jgi:hypothetical protein
LKRYLVVLSNSDKFDVLKRINQFKGATVEEKYTFGGEVALVITVFAGQGEFLEIIKGSSRIIEDLCTSPSSSPGVE